MNKQRTLRNILVLVYSCSEVNIANQRSLRTSWFGDTSSLETHAIAGVVWVERHPGTDGVRDRRVLGH